MRSRRRSRSRIAETWRSLISWMHWRRRREERLRLMLREELDLLQGRLEMHVQRQMLDMAKQIAGAMQRQDQLGMLRSELARANHREMLELMTEVLNSLQPNPETAVRELVGLPPGRSKPLPSSLASGISATP